jgi:hypothetical protein
MHSEDGFYFMGDDLDSHREDKRSRLANITLRIPKKERCPTRRNLGTDAAVTLLGSVLALQRAQEIQQVLLLLW